MLLPIIPSDNATDPPPTTMQPGIVLCTAREMLTIGKGHYAFPTSAM